MKSYNYARNTVELNEANISDLLHTLGVNEHLEAEVAYFIKINFPKDRNFYHFVSHVLTMNGTCTIMAPDNWEPINLFYQLGRVLKGNDIELVSGTKVEGNAAYDIALRLNGVDLSVRTGTADPSALFETINKHLSKHQFIRLISHLKQRRNVEWLLIPVPFDSETFKRITGCSEVKEEWEAN